MPSKTIGVFALIPNSPGQVVTTKMTNQAVSYLYDANQTRSLTRFWREVMDGYFELVPTLHSITRVEAPATLVSQLSGGTPRGTLVETAAAMLESAGATLTGYDTLAIYVCGPQINAGTSALLRDGNWIPTSIFDDFGSLSFLQHEHGHLLGLDHPFDPDVASPVALNGEYGFPPCIMSAENFGNRASSFPVPASEQSPVFAASDVVWARCGPGVSTATAWRFAPEFPGALPWITMLPANAPPTMVTLHRAGFDNGTRLVAMPSDGGTWFTAEYRPAEVWDQAFTPRADAGQTFSGVVISEFRDVGQPSDGPEWPKRLRVCYEATIPTPSTGDSDWSNGRFAVRLVSAGPQFAVIEVGRSVATSPTISLDFNWIETFESASPGPVVPVSRVGENCGTGEYTSNRSLYTAELTGALTTAGFASPVFRFELNGVGLGTWAAVDEAFSNVATVEVLVAVPTSTTASSTTTQSIPVVFHGSGNSIVIEVPSGAGAYGLDLIGFVTEGPTASAVGAGMASAAGHADLKTLRYELPASAIQDMGACLRSMAHRVGLKTWPPPRDEHPDWLDHGLIDVWTQNPVTDLGSAVLAAIRLEATNPAIGVRVVEDASAQLHMQPDEFRDLGRGLERELQGPG